MPTNYKVLGQVAPDLNTDTTLYTTPSSTQTIISTLVVSNRSGSAVSYRIAVRPNGETLANKHYIAFDITVGAGDSTTLTLGLTLSASDVVTVRASSANLSFSAFGSEITA
jgi:hypothetical protein